MKIAESSKVFLRIYSEFKLFSNLFPLVRKRTSGHLLHEDLDVSVLRNGAQILNNVPVLQVLVEGDLLVEGLRVSDVHAERVRKRAKKKPHTMHGSGFLCDPGDSD